MDRTYHGALSQIQDDFFYLKAQNEAWKYKVEKLK